MNKDLMTEQQLRDQMVTMARSMFERGYATGGAGNLSVKLPNGHFLATPTGSSFGRLVAEELSVVDIDGNHISGKKPSKEVAFHLAIYRNNSQCNAIVHLHSTYLTALSCLEELDRANAIKAFTPYFVMRIGELPVILTCVRGIHKSQKNSHNVLVTIVPSYWLTTARSLQAQTLKMQ